MGADAEPKADADPYYGYYGLGYHGLGYGLRAYGYGYPYAYGHYGYYGKRSADAEPTAVAEAKPEADPLRILRPWLPRLRIRTPCLRIRLPLRLRPLRILRQEVLTPSPLLPLRL